MELIKKIKETEVEAQEIIDRAKADAAKDAQEGRARRFSALAEAEQKRRKTIESAVAAARSQGLAEAQRLKEQAEKNRQQLRERTEDRISAAATKVVSFLKD